MQPASPFSFSRARAVTAHAGATKPTSALCSTSSGAPSPDCKQSFYAMRQSSFDGSVRAGLLLHVYATCKALVPRKSLFNLKCLVTTRPPAYERKNAVVVIIPKEEVIKLEAEAGDVVDIRMWDPSERKVKVNLTDMSTAEDQRVAHACGQFGTLDQHQRLVVEADSDCTEFEIATDVLLREIDPKNKEERVVVHLLVQVRRKGAEHLTMKTDLACTIDPFTINEREMFSMTSSQDVASSAGHGTSSSLGPAALAKTAGHEAVLPSPVTGGRYRPRSGAFSMGSRSVLVNALLPPSGSKDLHSPSLTSWQSTSTTDSGYGCGFAKTVPLKGRHITLDSMGLLEKIAVELRSVTQLTELSATLGRGIDSKSLPSSESLCRPRVPLRRRAKKVLEMWCRCTVQNNENGLDLYNALNASSATEVASAFKQDLVQETHSSV